jgi:post-segregation antitoxin (ccd killing protein)
MSMRVRITLQSGYNRQQATEWQQATGNGMAAGNGQRNGNRQRATEWQQATGNGMATGNRLCVQSNKQTCVNPVAYTIAY